ncbi:fungal specific transcription factor [Paraphaeosphaeria sporulosa]
MPMVAPQVCLTCKGRKKRCDKQLPSCGYCEQNNKTCCYEYGGTPHSLSPTQATESPVAHTPPQIASPASIGSIHDARFLDATIPREVMQIIDATQQSIHDISSRYFNGIHLWVPFLCPDRFGKDLFQFQAVPTAQFSLLLLCMCLVTYDPPEDQPPPIDQNVLYFHAKTLFTQIQLLTIPSTHHIQAGLLISVYEYAHGRPGSALLSTDICARMAYRIGMNKKHDSLGWSEAWNTWWAIVIFERIFYCESTLTDIPLVTAAPDETALLPHEVGDCTRGSSLNPGFRVAPVSQSGIGCLGRAAQAAYLLDRVIHTIKATSVPTTDRIAHLIYLDGELQSLLSIVMKKCHGLRGGHCGAVGSSIRALSMLHQHILHLEATAIDSRWRNHSQAALDTVAQMIVEISRSHRGITSSKIDIISPVCNYVIRHTLQYIYVKRYEDSQAWFDDSDALRESLAKLDRRWSFEMGTFANTETKGSVTSIDVQS